jgi:hypothetical protein
MSYQLYIPGQRLPPQEHFAAIGMADLLDPGCASAAIAAPQGPDGASGTVYFWEGARDEGRGARDGGPPGFHPEQQSWTACKARKELPAARVWFGRGLAASRGLSPFAQSAEQKGTVAPAQIIPASIARAKQLASTPVPLADGQAWLVPTALRLPKRWTIDELGQGVQVLQSRYQRYYDRCEQIYNWFLRYARGLSPFAESAEQKGTVPTHTIPGGFSLAVEALTLNYRLNADLIDWLGLFDDESLVRLCGATFEWEILREVAAQKKTAE